MKKIIFITFFCMLFSQNTSFDFTNGTYGRIPLTESLSNFNEFTVEFWYYQIGSGEEFIVATEYFNTGWGFHNENPNVLQLRIENGPYSLGGNNFSIPYNEWVHIAGVYDGSTLYLFVNGNLIASESYSGSISDSRNEDIVINRHVWASGSSSRLSGQLDELRISNIARYTSNFNPPNYEFENDNNTMGLWHFNNDFNDYSGNGNHGIHNGTGYSNNIPSFIERISGCIDELACNYNEDANTSDDSCDYSCHDNGDYSLSFDGEGSSVIDLENFEFATVDSITFSLDFNLDNFIYQSDHNHIFDFEGQNIRYTLVAGTDYVEMRLEGYSISYRFDANPLDSQWHNIIIQSTANSMNIIYDGNLVVSEVWSEPLVSHGYMPHDIYGTYIGANALDSGQYYIKGKLDNFIISNKILSFNDIQNSNFLNSLILHYKFNAGAGNILYDYSGNGNHGSINAATWISNDTTPNVYNVPGEFSSIQEAINYSADEDTIYVASGTYYENINIDNKNIFLIGENSENTIIDGSNNGRVVNILNSSDSLSIQNFSIINGERYGNGADGYGGGIFIENSNVNFVNINVSNCTVSDKGAGMWITSNSNVLLENSKVYNNNIYSSSQFGGGIGSSEANLIIKNSLISNNYSDDAGGLYHSNGLLEIYNSTITYNGGHEHNHNYSAGLLTINSYGLITNTIIYDNDNSIPSIHMESSDIDISFSNIEDYFGGENNINTDPLFLDPSNYNYTLSPDSPCIDMGNPNSQLDPDGTIADIGAYYYDQTFEDNNPNIHFVPEEFSSIQSAIDNSIHGDTILVSLGIYYENINFNGKNVSLIGEDRSTTIIDGDENGPVISFINSENNDALLKSFTIRNGSGQTMGAGIRVYQASPTLDDLIVENNSGSNHGGGIALEYGSAIVKNSIIRNNSTITGGGIYCNGNPTLDHLEITGNYASGDGGGITLSNCSPAMTHITVADNTAPIGSGIQLAWDGTDASITNSIVRGDIDTYGDPSLSATYSNIENNWNGNGVFDADPLFFDPSDGNYSLQSDSPCIDSADPNSSLDPDGTRADMGAYFYDQPTTQGCMDELACNFDITANFDNGNCDYTCHDNGDHSLNFDGDDFVEVGNSVDINPIEALSVSLWFKTNNSGRVQYIFGNETSGTNDGFSIHLRERGCLWFQMVDNVTGKQYSESVEEYNDGSWHHLIATWSSVDGLGRVYVDGQEITYLDNNQFTVNDYNPSPINYTIGTKLDNNDNGFIGEVDEIKLFHISFDESEINNLFNDNFNYNPVAYYKFNEGEGNMLHDHSGNQNHGAVNGATWVALESSEEDSFNTNYAIHFDYMSGYAESNLSAQQTFNNNESFTVEVWYKNDGVDSGNNVGYDDQAMIVSSYRRSGNGDPYNNFNLKIYSPIESDAGKVYADHGAVSNNRLDDGLWHHIAATYSSNGSGLYDISLYVDGEFNNTSTGTAEWDHISSGNKIRINNWSPFAGDHMLDCYLAGLSISSGIKYSNDFNPEFPLVTNDNTLINLDFSNGESSTLVDLGGSSNNFNIHGSFQWIDDVPDLSSPDLENPNTYFVPDQFSSIQAAIDNSIDGDTILVSAGTYYENINFDGKNISLIGEDRNTTIIDGGADGSVIHFENGISETTQIKSFTIQNGHAEDGGGIYCINSSPKLIDIILKNNIADDDGAAIWMENSNPLIESLIIYDNSANDHAGGIMILGNSNPNLISTTIYNNISNNEGSGITIHNSLATINNCEIYNNNAGMGGGIYIANHEFQDNEVVITNSDIQGNFATHGGGIYANGGKLNIVDSNIKGNNAGYAGGLWVNNINLSINMSKFTENVSQECSGAIYSSNSQILMSKVEITDNIANDNCHSAVYLDNNTQANLNKLTVANNGSGESEQDFGVYDSNVNIFNSIILEDFLDISSNLIITYSNVAYEDEVWVGIGNIAQEPYFTDPENGDYTLQIISPCIDAGDPDSDFDEDGTIADMGAYSFNQTENPIIYGCTNSSAENYSQEANIEDGSCFCSEGYTDIDYECLLTGDVNQDAYIDIVDVITIIQITLDIYEYSGVEFILADFNSDDSVDISDIVAIINYILEN